MFQALAKGFRYMLPESSRRRMGRMRRRMAIGLSTEPSSRNFGMDRGLPVDRHIIERFVAGHAADIRGDVLEIADARYTRQFGRDNVHKSHVLSIDPKCAEATIIADISAATDLPCNVMDCIICTQTLQFVFDVKNGIEALHKMLKPGGVLLVTVPAITQVARYDMDQWGEFWRFTSLSMKRLLTGPFDSNSVEVKAHGNVLTAAAFLYGLPSSDLRQAELELDDRDYEMLITARAVKAG